MKISLCNKKLWKEYFSILGVILTIVSFVLIFIDIDTKEMVVGLAILSVLILIYIILCFRANFLSKIILKINNSRIEIKVGNIFEEEGYKVIAFNEYFDTKVDDIIISKQSLNGQYIEKKLYKENDSINSIQELNAEIEKSKYLSNKKLEINNERIDAKKQKYKLGSIFKLENYLLTAMTKFDNENRAYLLQVDYINFLLEFWNNLDTIYNGKTVVVPIFGSGITRFKENINISDQELLNIMVLSFKISRMKFTYPSKLKIVIYEGKKDKINLYQLKQLEEI